MSERDLASWEQMKLALKSDLKSISVKLAREKGFTEVRPGQDDYETCFREWWLSEVKRMPNGLLLVTTASDEDATEAGLKKYRSRLTRLAKRLFERGRDLPVNFKVLRKPATKPRDEWEQAKAELAYRIGLLPRREALEATANYENAIQATRLASAEMDGAAKVWRIEAVNAKKTRAVLSLLRRHVDAAVRQVSGAEVQIVVVELEGR